MTTIIFLQSYLIFKNSTNVSWNVSFFTEIASDKNFVTRKGRVENRGEGIKCK